MRWVWRNMWNLTRTSCAACSIHRHGFEAFDVSGSLRRAILGGGRYDNLLRDVAAIRSPGLFCDGDVVIGLVLQELGLIPALATTPAGRACHGFLT